MAVLVFKDDRQIKIEPEHLQHYIDMGWSPEKTNEEPETKSDQTAEIDFDQMPEVDFDQTAEINFDQTAETILDQTAEKKPIRSKKGTKKNKVSDE